MTEDLEKEFQLQAGKKTFAVLVDILKDIQETDPAFTIGKIPAASKAMGDFLQMHSGLTYPEMKSWLHWMGGQELHDELAGEFGLKCVPMGNTGVQWGGRVRPADGIGAAAAAARRGATQLSRHLTRSKLHIQSPI